MSTAQYLNGFLASLVLQDVVKSDGGPDEYVHFSDYMVRAGFLFETGVVLGYTYRDCLVVFAKLIASPGTEERVISLLKEDATNRLAKFTHQPSAVELIYFAPEATRLISLLRDAGPTDATDWLEMHKVAEQKLRVADVFGSIQMAIAAGIGFGSRYPDLTSQLLTAEIGTAEYHRLRAAGLNGPATPPARKTILQRQQMALSMIRPFVQRVRPDLAEALNL